MIEWVYDGEIGVNRTESIGVIKRGIKEVKPGGMNRMCAVMAVKRVVGTCAYRCTGKCVVVISVSPGESHHQELHSWSSTNPGPSPLVRHVMGSPRFRILGGLAAYADLARAPEMAPAMEAV